MNILTKNIIDITFQDIVSFCSEGHPEGIQLDYKIERPPKGLAKHFAAFSNSRGGLIIIGVEENKESGLPEKWEGIKKDAKLIEQIHQDASNVDPFPIYEVNYTDEVEGRNFLLIRILEGTQTPYHVFNDPNFWVRTGNIKKAIDLANPKQVELLFEKRSKSEQLRNLLLKQADEAFTAGLRRAERERVSNIAEEKRNYEQETKLPKEKGLIVEPLKSTVYPHELGKNSSMCKVYLLPHTPESILATPQELKNMGKELQIRPTYADTRTETTPYGIMDFLWVNYNGYIECHQIFSKGLVYYNSDVEDVGKDKIKVIMISFVTGALYRVIDSAKIYYIKTKYHGGIKGEIVLSDVEGMHIRQIVPNNYYSGRNQSFKCLLPEYTWDIEINTSILFDSTMLKKWFHEKINEIYIYLGLPTPLGKLIDDFCTQEGLSFE